MSEASSSAVKKDRSPSFPFIPLGEALKRLAAFEQTFGRHPAPAAKSGLAWGMKEGSSQAFQTLAALKAFGLLKYEGSAKDRTALLTEDARTYLRAQQESIKKEIVRSIATKPAQIQKFWSVWGADRPPDAVCLDDLVLKHAFTDSAAHNFLKVYDETIAFAGISDDKFVDEYENSEAEYSVGDFVNWESNGQIQWPEPRKIIAIDEHDDGNLFYKVEGEAGNVEQTGWIPVEQATTQGPQKSFGAFSPPPPVKTPSISGDEVAVNKGQRKAVFPVSEGDVTFVFPEALTAEGLEELEMYLEVFLKKEKRKILGK